MADQQLLLLSLILSFTGCHSQACGQAPLNNRIIGGQDAPNGSWPWMVSLSERGSHHCGGSLINDQWILTAAHCISPGIENTTKVYLGRQSSMSSLNNENEVARGIDVVDCHPLYTTGKFENDICLLKLSAPVTFTNYIQPVCLAAAGSTFYTGLNTWLAGWGALDASFPTSPDTLQEVSLPVVGPNECKCLNTLPIPDNTVCAGYPQGGQDTCAGDSGGAQVVKLNSVWVQAGIVSFGEGCAKPNKPGVYTDVSKFQDWIMSIVGSYNPPGFVHFYSPGVNSDLTYVCPNDVFSGSEEKLHISKLFLASGLALLRFVVG